MGDVLLTDNLEKKKIPLRKTTQESRGGSGEVEVDTDSEINTDRPLEFEKPVFALRP